MMRYAGLLGATLLGGEALLAALPNVDSIELEGEYPGHLQDVWYDGGSSLYWAHTEYIVRTDLAGHVLAQTSNSAYHHAGLEMRNGRVYTAICLQSDMATVGTQGHSRVMVGEYDATTLAEIAIHTTDVLDRAGSLSILDDGTFLVGCLRQNDMGVGQVRYHHLDADFNLIKSHPVDNVPVQMGIETLKVRGPFRYLNVYGSDAGGHALDFNCIKIDANDREVWRGSVGADRGLVFDGGYIWLGDSTYSSSTKKWSSRLVRRFNDLPASVVATAHAHEGGGTLETFDVAFDPVQAPRTLYLACGADDAGGVSTNGWSKVLRLADISAGATEVRGIAAPRELGMNGSAARFFLGPSASAGSTAYVAGLLAQWDGIDNAGRGMHDPAASYPVELVGNTAQTLTGSVPAGPRHFALGAGYLTFSSPSIIDACNAGAATVEVLMTPNGTPVSNGGIVAFGDTARALWVYEGAGIVGDMSYHGAISGEFQSIHHPASAPHAETNLFSFVLGGTSAASRLLVDATRKSYALTRFPTTCPDTTCRIGTLANRWVGTKAPVDVCSLRVYGRTLSLAEIEHNRHVDALRFTGEDAFLSSDLMLVPVPFSVTRKRTPNGLRATAIFTPRPVARRLVVAWGDRDGGTTTNGWAHAATLCDVPANAGRVRDVALPFDYGADTLSRFFLLGGDSSSYVMDGLIAQWDGIDNAGRGVHNPSASYPVELVGSTAQTLTGTVPARARHFELGSGYLTFTHPAIIDACNAGAATVEILSAPRGTLVHNGGLLAFGDTSRAFWIYQRNASGLLHAIGDCTYHGVLSGEYQSLNLPAVPCTTNLCSFVLGADANAHLYVDGVEARGVQRFTTDCTDAVCRIGSLGGSWTNIKPSADVFSIRVYNRLLTVDEIAANRAVDGLRFLDVPEVSALVPDRCFSVIIR